MIDEDTVTVAAAPDAVHDLPPSCKLVWLVLANQGELTHKEIVEETLLSERTARWARQRLVEADVITSCPSIQDARKEMYAIRESSAIMT